MPIFSTDTGDVISALVVGSSRFSPGRRTLRRDEKRHLGEWPIAFAFASEICGDIVARKIADAVGRF